MVNPGVGGRRRQGTERTASAVAEDAGMSLVHMALAFVLQHPGVTAPIIGPRTMEQLESQLGAVDVTLTTDVLDRIDEIVPPGVTLSRADIGYLTPALPIPAQAS
jgi:aryl-alcohol dehydrogenase-like predicted oxidoreductase